TVCTGATRLRGVACGSVLDRLLAVFLRGCRKVVSEQPERHFRRLGLRGEDEFTVVRRGVEKFGMETARIRQAFHPHPSRLDQMAAEMPVMAAHDAGLVVVETYEHRLAVKCRVQA